MYVISLRDPDGGCTLQQDAVKIVNNPTYEQRGLNSDQDTSNVELSEVSAHYSTLGPTYDSIKGANIRVAMLQDDRVKKKGKRKLRHTEPVRGTHTRDALSTDSCGYSRLFQK